MQVKELEKHQRSLEDENLFLRARLETISRHLDKMGIKLAGGFDKNKPASQIFPIFDFTKINKSREVIRNDVIITPPKTPDYSTNAMVDSAERTNSNTNSTVEVAYKVIKEEPLDSFLFETEPWTKDLHQRTLSRSNDFKVDGKSKQKY